MNKLIVNQIDSLIADATLKRDETRLFTYRAIKDEFLKWKTAKCNVGKEFSSEVEIKILNTMANGGNAAMDAMGLKMMTDLVDKMSK